MKYILDDLQRRDESSAETLVKVTESLPNALNTFAIITLHKTLPAVPVSI